MNYEQFLGQMKEDLQARFSEDLPPELADVRIGIRDVEKLQGESYRGLSFRSGDSPVEANLNMTGAFQAYEAGRPYEDILEEVEAQLMKAVDRTPQFNIGKLTDYEAMKPKLMMEVIPQKGNEERLENIPHQKVEDIALIYRVDMGDSSGGKMTSVITNQQLKSFGRILFFIWCEFHKIIYRAPKGNADFSQYFSRHVLISCQLLSRVFIYSCQPF